MARDRHSERLADFVTYPDAMQELKALRKLSPRSQKAIDLVARTLTMHVGEAGADWLRAPEESLPAVARSGR